MAQRAVVTSYKAIRGTGNLNELIICASVSLLQESVIDPFISDLEVLTLWTDTNAQMKTKLVTAILALASANGYTQLTSTDVFLPNYTKG